jgi:hypothetical protein
MGERDQRLVDRMGREIEEARLERPVQLDRPLAGQAPVDIVVGAEDGGDMAKTSGS